MMQWQIYWLDLASKQQVEVCMMKVIYASFCVPGMALIQSEIN